MKRLFIVASLAIMAVACQKEEVRNEVLTPIGFNTEAGKLTRAIQPETDGYSDNFGVYAYLYNENVKAGQTMDNQKVTSAGKTVDKTTGADVAYYWPNDPDNHLNFYAYSPFNLGTVAMEEEGILTLTDYEHTNYTGAAAVDFMVANAVEKATFAGTYGEGEPKPTYGAGVPIVFNHEMTQIVFKVSTNFNGGTITLTSITLEDVVNKATYTGTTIGALANWVPATNGTGQFDLTLPESTTVTSTGITTVPVTMIPQTLASQNFTIEYDIKINGVIEKVSKNFKFTAATSAIADWNPNAKVIYNLSIGLNTISFIPSVVDWAEDTNGGNYTF